MREMKGHLTLTGMPPADCCRRARARMCELRVVYPKQRGNASRNPASPSALQSRLKIPNFHYAGKLTKGLPDFAAELVTPGQRDAHRFTAKLHLQLDLGLSRTVIGKQ